jgi:hypothetical protein
MSLRAKKENALWLGSIDERLRHLIKFRNHTSKMRKNLKSSRGKLTPPTSKAGVTAKLE